MSISTIEPDRLLTSAEALDVRGSLALADTTLKDFAAEKQKSYDRMSRMVRRVEAVTPSYAKVFNALVDRHIGAAVARLAA